MVIDTSVLICILLGEPETELFAKALAADGKRYLSSFNALETAIVIEAKKGDPGNREFDLLLNRARIEVVSLNNRHVALARQAWKIFGKGRHPAGLNIGDCCAYALSKAMGEPLLFKGNDFALTDLPPVKLPNSDF